MATIETGFVDPDRMLKSLQEKMNSEMMAAAEPVIKKAVEEAEKEMRRRLGAMVVGLIEQSFSIERFGSDLRIHVKIDRRP